jgi:hypothetical protein
VVYADETLSKTRAGVVPILLGRLGSRKYVVDEFSECDFLMSKPGIFIELGLCEILREDRVLLQSRGLEFCSSWSVYR